MKRIVCIRWKSDDCRYNLQIDELRASYPRSSALQILNHCQRFSPLVGVEPTDNESILLDITGLAHLFGGEAALCEAIVSDFGRLGLAARVAVADTIGAAWAAARCGMKWAVGSGQWAVNLKSEIFDPSSFIPHPSSLRPPPSALIIPPGQSPAFLAPLPPAALRLPGETVRLLGELGVTRIGQLEALPREEFSSRFGPALLRRLDQAFGRLDEPVPPVPVCNAVRGPLVGRVADRPPRNNRRGGGATGWTGGRDAEKLRAGGPAAGMSAEG